MGKKDKPFGGAITQFFEDEFPKKLRKKIDQADKNDILSSTYPYPKRLEGKIYDEAYQLLQIELVKLQSWVVETGQRLVVVFEGRDAAGKGGTIKRVRENLNPRVARVVALAKPSDRETTQWYFQRYVQHMPAAGEIVLFDRSWYNRAVVEHVFGFCTNEQRELFFRQVPLFERGLINDGVHLVKIWLTCSRSEQMRRVLARERDPLKQWKLSSIDVESLNRWETYSHAIEETFERTHSEETPWRVIRSDDKRRGRLAAIELILSGIDYARKDEAVARPPNPLLSVGPDFMEDDAD
ncbi:MAG: polyphosphate kinase 2 [Pseudomonadota bacterium]